MRIEMKSSMEVITDTATADKLWSSS
ncbi:hypothetical protein TIFTF001_056668, partial [Ficus carica]